MPAKNKVATTATAVNTTGIADYKSLSSELDKVLMQLQAPDVSVDEAVQMYEQGVKLVAQLEARVKQAENKLEQLH